MESMYLSRFVVCGATLALTCCGPSNPTVKALTGAALIDGTGSAVLRDAVVVVNGNDIQAAGARGSVTVPAEAKTVDLKGKFIVPGLIDVRVSLPGDAATAAPLLRTLLKSGITSIGVSDGGPALRDDSPRTLPSGEQTAGFADLVIASGGSNPDSFFLKVDRMAKAEVAGSQILVAATKNGAQWLKQERLGVLAPGHKADLLVLDADPVADIRNLRKVDRVMLDGSWVK